MAIANAPKRNFDKAPLIAALQALLGDRCSLDPKIFHGAATKQASVVIGVTNSVRPVVSSFVAQRRFR